jgi:hypothetical protein
VYVRVTTTMTQPVGKVDPDHAALVEYLRSRETRDPPPGGPAHPAAPPREPVDSYRPGGPVTDHTVCKMGCHGVPRYGDGRTYTDRRTDDRLALGASVLTAGVPVGGAIRAGTTAVTAASRRLSSLFARRATQAAPAAPVAATLPRTLVAAERQLQMKFKHAGDFGVTGNYNRASAQQFREALQRHVSNPEVRQIVGQCRKNDAIHYLDPRSGLNVVTDRAGNFITGWRLEGVQLRDVSTRGWLW